MKTGEIYAHFKGGTYTLVLTEILGIPQQPQDASIIMTAKLEATMEEVEILWAGTLVVVDPSIAGKMCVAYCAHKSGGLFVRTEEDFIEVVNKPDHFYAGPRFRKVG